MKILINCSNLRFGGAKTVGLNIINQLKQKWVNDDNEIVIIAPSTKDYEQFSGAGVTLEYIAAGYNKPWAKLVLNNIKLPRLAQKHKPAFILSLGNIAFPTHIAPQLLLLHIPYPVYPESIVWKRLSFRYALYLNSMVHLIKKNIKYASYLFVQTETMKKRANQYLKIDMNKIKLLPNSVSFTSIVSTKAEVRSKNDTIKLLLLSKLYPHKNFDILIPLALEIKKRQVHLSITVTIDAGDNSESAQFLKKVADFHLEHIIVNHGHVPFDKIADIYSAHDGLFLPTLLESFSGTYIESFYFKKPVFTSDMDFAREVCGEAGYYFDPLDEISILDTITSAFKDQETMCSRIKTGEKLCQQFPTWDEIGTNLIKFIEIHQQPENVKRNKQ